VGLSAIIFNSLHLDKFEVQFKITLQNKYIMELSLHWMICRVLGTTVHAGSLWFADRVAHLYRGITLKSFFLQ